MMLQDDDDGVPRWDDSSSTSSDSDNTLASVQVVLRPDGSEVSNEALSKFLAYLEKARIEYHPFSKHEVAAIKLIDLLRRKRATLDTYEEVVEWHFRTNGDIPPKMSLGEYTHYISRAKLIKTLNKRYHGPKDLFYIRSTILPVSRAKVDLIYHDARDCLVSLLTDPRFSDQDFQHFDDNPLAPPPDSLDYVGDTITGRAYLKTYQKLITNPEKQMLVPIQMYIDGAISGQFGKLPVEALKFTLGIFTEKARSKRYAWRTLGYVPNYHKAGSRGKKLFAETGHLSVMNLLVDDEEGEEEANDEHIDWDEDGEDEDSVEGAKKPSVINPDKVEYDDDAHEGQDWHHILAHLLVTYRKLEQEGMLWHYKYKGKIHKDIELVFFLHFVKCDGDEADKLCGKYTTRTGNVANLCRFCTCPTNQSSWVFGDKYSKKTEPKIKKLLDRNDLKALQKMSQRNLVNAFHGLRFGLHSDAGIHGACPMEMLHHILLGMFKYVITGMKEQIGKSSGILHEINALAKHYGAIFARNSERDLPKTAFSQGIFQGKIMGKEYTGVLLVALAVFKSALGQKILKKMRRFQIESRVEDWTMLLETMLQWESFLKLEVMQKKHVRKLKDKHRYVMYLMKKVLRRTKGMGFDVMKFHGILHLAEGILNDGVPNCVDTGHNESHHKPTKYYSKLTQKNVKTFEKQTAQREDEFHLIDLAMLEMEGKAGWDYLEADQVRGPPNLGEGSQQPAQDTVKPSVTSTGGTQIRVCKDIEGNLSWDFPKQKNCLAGEWDTQVVQFLYDLQAIVSKHVGWLNIRTEHKRDGQIFRGHPDFKQSGEWNDWVKLDWGKGYGHLPAEIWCYVDLSTLPEGISLEFGEEKVTRGIYAVIESSYYVQKRPDPGQKQPNRDPAAFETDLFRPFWKEVAAMEGKDVTRKFYLADVDSFVAPLCVIPDVGADDILRYYEVKPRKDWAKFFIEWLEQPVKEEMEELERLEGKDEYLQEIDRKTRPKKETIKPKKGKKGTKANG